MLRGWGAGVFIAAMRTHPRHATLQHFALIALGHLAAHPSFKEHRIITLCKLCVGPSHPRDNEIQSLGRADQVPLLHRDAGLQYLVQHVAMEALCALVALPSHTAAVICLVPVLVAPASLYSVPAPLHFFVRRGEACDLLLTLDPTSSPPASLLLPSFIFSNFLLSFTLLPSWHPMPLCGHWQGVMPLH